MKKTVSTSNMKDRVYCILIALYALSFSITAYGDDIVQTYHNPVSKYSLPDPTVIMAISISMPPKIRTTCPSIVLKTL